MKKLALLIISLILYSSCTKEYTLNVTVSPLEGGSVSPAIGTYKDGSSVSIALKLVLWTSSEWNLAGLRPIFSKTERIGFTISGE